MELEQLVAADGGKTWENLLALEQRQQLAQARGEQLPIVALTAGSVTRKRGRTPKEPGTLVRQDARGKGDKEKRAYREKNPAARERVDKPSAVFQAKIQEQVAAKQQASGTALPAKFWADLSSELIHYGQYKFQGQCPEHAALSVFV